MKILLLGKNGQLGWELNRSLLPLGTVVALGREEADFSRPERLADVVRNVNPDVVVNAAAYTKVDLAESEQDLAGIVNMTAPAVLAEECERIGALIVHYSTDYVFDGQSQNPYKEESPTNPLNVYGSTKYEGEQAVRNSCARHLIIRSSWVFASRGNNFVRTIIDLANRKDKLQIVDDQRGAPTWARNIADVSACMIRDVIRVRGKDTGKAYGTYHVSSAGECSWFEFSKSILSWLERNGIGRSVEISPIKSCDYDADAQRPPSVILDNTKVMEAFSVKQLDWECALDLCMAELRG